MADRHGDRTGQSYQRQWAVLIHARAALLANAFRLFHARRQIFPAKRANQLAAGALLFSFQF